MRSLPREPAQQEPGWVLLAGAAGGMGRAIAARLIGAGITVVGLDRAAAPGAMELLRCDLADDAQRKRVIGEAIGRRGPPGAVVWAAGTYLRRPLAEYDRTTFEEVVADNFTAAFFLLQQVLPVLRAAGGGRIVLIGSQAAATGGTDACYAAAKAALVGLAKSIAREYAADRITCNVVSPGPADTPMAAAMGDRRTYYEQAIPVGRLVAPDEVAGVVEFLLRDAGEALTGATIDVDGGLVRR